MDHNESNATSRSRLENLVANASDGDLRRPIDSVWTVAATLAHLAFWDRFVRARWRAVLDGADMDTAIAPPGGIDWTNAAGLPAWSAISPRQAAQDAIDAAAEVDELISRLPAWAIERVSELGRPGWLDRTRHRGQHLDQIAAALGRESGLTTDGAFELVTERLRLRDYRSGDVEAVHGFTSDPVVVRHVQFGPNTLDDTRAFLARAMRSARAVPRRSFEVALTDLSTDEVIGGIRLGATSDVHRDASLGYILRRDLWNRGLVTEAASALVDFGFTNLGLHRVWAICSVDNVGSARVLEKLGMKREAHLREHLWVRGSWRSSYLYAVIEREWLPPR